MVQEGSLSDKEKAALKFMGSGKEGKKKTKPNKTYLGTGVV